MIRPQRKDVRPLTRYDEEHFGRWLHTGFNAYFLEAKGRHGFMPMHTFVGLEADIVEDLVGLYSLLEITEQAGFRAGLAIALARTELTEHTSPVLEAMLSLAATIGAWEILSAIIDKHRFHWLLEGADDVELFDVTVRTIVALAVNAGSTSQTRKSARALVDIAASDRFPAAYGEPVMVALCRLQPDRAWPNLLTLRKSLDPLLDRVEDDEEDARRADLRMRLVNRMYQALGERNFVKALRMALQFEPNWEGDWWVATVIASRQPGDIPQAVWWSGRSHAPGAVPFHIPPSMDKIRRPSVLAAPAPVLRSGVMAEFAMLFSRPGGHSPSAGTREDAR